MRLLLSAVIEELFFIFFIYYFFLFCAKLASTVRECIVLNYERRRINFLT